MSSTIAFFVARNPDKLRSLVLAANVSEATVSAHLTIVQGPAQDVEAVKQTLKTRDGHLASRIVFAIGAAPVLQWSLFRPVTLDDPTVCETAITTILSAVSSLSYPVAPLVALVSTTGIGARRDVPYAFIPFYKLVLAVPHEDKEKLEEAAHAAQRQGVVRGVVVVKASLLMDGDADEAKLRVGNRWKGRGEDDVAIGYTVTRGDVGDWMFRVLVKGDDEEWGTSEGGRIVTLTR
ncbi:hypothetical protein MNV49_003338 [Pseudohyphozyma bogoriensis]|nr:hypothetical protein MNV49_003338 [Pseudohyphozyma bogoriensis]